MGALTTWACGAGGKWAVIGHPVLHAGSGPARAVPHLGREGAAGSSITILSAGAAYGTYLYLPAGRGYPLLGVAVGVGCIVHLLGDVITSAGVPILWPIPTGRRMWRMIGVPNALAVSVGGKVETVLLRGAFAIVCLAAAVGLVGPAILEKFDIRI